MVSKPPEIFPITKIWFPSTKNSNLESCILPDASDVVLTTCLDELLYNRNLLFVLQIEVVDVLRNRPPARNGSPIELL